MELTLEQEFSNSLLDYKRDKVFKYFLLQWKEKHKDDIDFMVDFLNFIPQQYASNKLHKVEKEGKLEYMYRLIDLPEEYLK